MRHRLRSVRVLVLVVVLVLAGCTAGTGPATDGTADVGAGSVDDGGGERAVTEGSSDGTLEIHFINVGQADSTLVVGPTGETMLVDTGPFTDDGERVIDYLESQGVDRIDYLVSTHADADHIGGNAAVIEHFETQGEGVGAVYDPGVTASTATYDRYLDAVEEYDVPLYLTLAGDTIPLEGVSARVLGPPDPYLAGGERNENSIVVRLSHGRTSALLPGDAGSAGEQYLVETHGDALDVTLLKAGHHGSDTSSSAALLDASTPKVVVVSSAYDSRFEHPHDAVLDRLAARGIPAYWTGTHGTVVATSDGRAFEIATQVDAGTDPTDLRADAPVDPDTRGPVVVRATFTGDGAPAVTDTPSSVEVTTVNADPAGDDRENLVDEYVVLTNRGTSSVDIGGWTVRDESGATYRIPDGVVLVPGDSLTIRTGSGTDTESELYWGSGRPVWNNDGDTVTVRAPDGRLVTEVSYP